MNYPIPIIHILKYKRVTLSIYTRYNLLLYIVVSFTLIIFFKEKKATVLILHLEQNKVFHVYCLSVVEIKQSSLYTGKIIFTFRPVTSFSLSQFASVAVFGGESVNDGQSSNSNRFCFVHFLQILDKGMFPSSFFRFDLRDSQHKRRKTLNVTSNNMADVGDTFCFSYFVFHLLKITAGRHSGKLRLI